MAKDKTRSEYIIDTLLSGKPRRSTEITRMVCEAMDEEIRGEDVSSVLAKLSNSDICNLSYFIKKEKTNSEGFKFSLFKEMQELEPDEVYNLTRKFGQHNFPLKKAFRKVPKLRKYVTAAKRRARPGRRPDQPPKDSGRETFVTAGLSEVIAVLGDEFAKQGGLKVNFNLNFHMEGFVD